MSAYDQMQPRFDELPAELRKAKVSSGLTIQELSDEAGVPIDFSSSVSSGTMKRPSLFYVAAVCKVFGLSLDRLTGLTDAASDNEYVRRIHELELEAARKDGEIKRLQALNAIKDEGLRNRRMLIFSLSAIVALLVCAVIGYIIFDIQLKNIGLFQSTGVAVSAVLLVIIVLAAVALIVYAIKTVAKEHKSPRN